MFGFPSTQKFLLNLTNRGIGIESLESLEKLIQAPAFTLRALTL